MEHQRRIQVDWDKTFSWKVCIYTIAVMATSMYGVLVCHRKYRGHTTRSELYGYRNGNKIEALELCMVPAGEEHTIGPRQVNYYSS